MFTSSIDGVPIRFEAKGLGSPALVFVHGWSCDRTYWRPQMAHFASEHRVVALDLGGHGDSGMDRVHWSMEAFGRDVVAVVEKLDLEKVVLVGHSMGGSVILEAAKLLPNRVMALVPVDTFFDVEQKLSKEQARQFVAPFLLDFRAMARAYLRDYMFTPETDPALKEAILADMSQAPPEVAIGSLEELVTYDYPAALQRIRVPIRCINSDKYVTKTEVARKYAPSFDVVLMSGVGHFPMMEKPEQFNKLLTESVRLAQHGEENESNTEI